MRNQNLLSILIILGVVAWKGSGTCQESKDIISIYNEITPLQIEFTKIEGSFSQYFYEEEADIQDNPYSRYFFLKPDNTIYKNLHYSVFYNENKWIDSISLYDREFIVKHFNNYSFDSNGIIVNLAPLSADVYEFGFYNKKYICIVTGGKSGLLDSGEFTQIQFFCLFDVTDKKNIIYYNLFSRFGRINSFGDFNKDNKLDFALVKNHPRHNQYELTFLTIENDRFIPLLNENNEKQSYLLETDNEGKFKIIAEPAH